MKKIRIRLGYKYIDILPIDRKVIMFDVRPNQVVSLSLRELEQLNKFAQKVANDKGNQTNYEGKQ